MGNALAIQMLQALSELWNNMATSKNVIRIKKPKHVWFCHKREANMI
jgi:hypothetical protein